MGFAIIEAPDVFMAIVEKIGKDRRGNPIYIRDDDGAELVFKKSISELLKSPKGDKILKKLDVFEREINDDLPKISKEYKKFLEA